MGQINLHSARNHLLPKASVQSRPQDLDELGGDKPKMIEKPNRVNMTPNKCKIHMEMETEHATPWESLIKVERAVVETGSTTISIHTRECVADSPTERVAEQEALDAGLARLARIRQEMLPTENVVPVTIPNGAEDPAVVINQLRARVAEMEAECEGLRKKRTRSLSVPSPVMPGVDQSMSVWGPEPDRRSVLMQTLIDQGSSLVPKSNRFSPL